MLQVIEPFGRKANPPSSGLAGMATGPYNVRVSKKPSPPPAAATPSPGFRRFLYFTSAMTGAIILIVEILGAKMLAPYFGTSHFVWTAQIGVTLISLAVGYWFGGWLVDRDQRPGQLYACLVGAAVYLGLVVLLCEPVSFACLKAGKLAFGSVLASAFLFLVPLTLLAATGPFVIRLLTSSVNQVGGQVGRLYAISTVGSVAGTVLIGYALLPFFPNSVTMLATAGVLLALAATYWIRWGRAGDMALIVFGAALLLPLGGAGVTRDLNWRHPGMELLYRANSDFGLLQVVRNKQDGHLYYLNDYLTQNTYDPVAKQSVSLFTYMLHGLAVTYTERLDRVLCIGLGVGIAPMQLARGGAQVDAVEINPAVVPLAQAHFDLEPDKLNLHIGDGRAFLRQTTGERYDAVVLDAFLGDSSPSHLMTKEAFEAVKGVLQPEGVLVINSFGDLDRGRDFFAASLHKTLQAVFASVKIHATGNGNVFFVASARPDLSFRRAPVLSDLHPWVRHSVERAYESTVQTSVESGVVLTDDFNPVEFHDAANREDMRRRLALGMKPR
jgi:spermidine synthase